MRGQVSVMEYMILVLMAMFIIFFTLVMVFGFQFLSIGSGTSAALEEKSLFFLQSFISSRVVGNPHFQKGSVLDDSKLTVMDCETIEEMFGEPVSIEVQTIYEKPDCEGLGGGDLYRCQNRVNEIEDMEELQCDDTNYPDCGVWTFCNVPEGERMIYRSVPVNIYKTMNSTFLLGTVTLGVASS